MGVYLPSTSSLPSEYQEVEYIQSSGTQYIDTNLLVNGDFTTEAKYAKTTNVAWNTLFGTRNGTYCRYLVRCNSDSNYFTVQRSYSSANTNTIETYESGNYYNNNIYTVKLNKYLYIDSTLLKTYTTSTTTNLFPYKLYVFALNSAGTAADFGYYKLYYMKIWDNYNYLLRDFIPCYRKSDNVIGLYDLVDNQFYTNSGSGTFGKGNNIIMSELKNAYIGEVWTPGSNTIAYYPLTSTTTVNDISGNNRNLTNNGTSFGTYAGVNCAYFSNSQSKKLYGNLPLTGNSTFTINVWLYRLGYVTVEGSQIFLLGPINTAGYCLGVSLEGSTWEYKYYTWGSDQKTSLVCPTNKWEMVTLTNDTSKVHLYVNGTLIKEGALTFNVNTTDFTIGAWNVIRHSNYQPFYGYMSELIAESAVWTANQIQGYYNNTKSNYGL